MEKTTKYLLWGGGVYLAWSAFDLWNKGVRTDAAYGKLNVLRLLAQGLEKPAYAQLPPSPGPFPPPRPPIKAIPITLGSSGTIPANVGDVIQIDLGPIEPYSTSNPKGFAVYGPLNTVKMITPYDYEITAPNGPYGTHIAWALGEAYVLARQ
jgi:hypothetical protein